MARRTVFFRPHRRNSNRKAHSIRFLIEEAIEDVAMMELLDTVESVGDMCWGVAPQRPYVEEIRGKGCYETEFGRDDDNTTLSGKSANLALWIRAAFPDDDEQLYAMHGHVGTDLCGLNEDVDDSWIIVPAKRIGQNGT